MRYRQWSRRDVLKSSTAFAAGALFAEPIRAAAPPPTEATPELIEAARKEGKISYYSALELNVAERLGKAFEAKYPGISVRVERSGAERIFRASRRSRAAASTRSTSPTRPTPRITSTGSRGIGWRRTCQRMSQNTFPRTRSIRTASMRPRAAGSRPSATIQIW